MQKSILDIYEQFRKAGPFADFDQGAITARVLELLECAVIDLKGEGFGSWRSSMSIHGFLAEAQTLTNLLSQLQLAYTGANSEADRNALKEPFSEADVISKFMQAYLAQKSNAGEVALKLGSKMSDEDFKKVVGVAMHFHMTKEVEDALGDGDA